MVASVVAVVAAIAATRKPRQRVADVVQGIHWPVPGCDRTSSLWGLRKDPFGQSTTECHGGLDIPCASGNPVVAIESGVVLRADFRSSSAGGLVIVSHGDGWETRYMHLSGLDVLPGAVVVGGKQIGQVGTTGRSTGPHLHLEVRHNGVSIDPGPFFGKPHGVPC